MPYSPELLRRYSLRLQAEAQELNRKAADAQLLIAHMRIPDRQKSDGAMEPLKVDSDRLPPPRRTVLAFI